MPLQDRRRPVGRQLQKIAIARAYMRDAQVMITDEPTAALDARSEFGVFQRFKELSNGRTAVLISTGSWCWPRDGWRRRGRTGSCLRRVAAMRSCSNCRRQGIGEWVVAAGYLAFVHLTLVSGFSQRAGRGGKMPQLRAVAAPLSHL